jgi:hypothetical protein
MAAKKRTKKKKKGVTASAAKRGVKRVNLADARQLARYWNGDHVNAKTMKRLTSLKMIDSRGVVTSKGRKAIRVKTMNDSSPYLRKSSKPLEKRMLDYMSFSFANTDPNFY